MPGISSGEFTLHAHSPPALTPPLLQLVCIIMKARTFILSLVAGTFPILCSSGCSAGVPVAEPLRVATMHPVLTHVAEVIGGDKVRTTAIVPAGADVHHFSPTASDVKKLAGMQIILVSGKGMENYLDKLRSNLSADQEVVEVGHNIPSLVIDAKDPTFMCCPEHANGAVDPHWWNSVGNMRLAGREVAKAFAKKDPANREYYRSNASAWDKRLGDLEQWAWKEISVIPIERRKLATGHLALSYFAKEFKFKMVAVQGLSDEANATPQDLAKAVKTVREQNVTAFFSEQGVNPKYLKQLAAESGAKDGGDIIADGNGTDKLASFEAAFTHNVKTIVAALKP
jgi:zinc/manganese transport system substrate-binding protein